MKQKCVEGVEHGIAGVSEQTSEVGESEVAELGVQRWLVGKEHYLLAGGVPDRSLCATEGCTVDVGVYPLPVLGTPRS